MSPPLTRVCSIECSAGASLLIIGDAPGSTEAVRGRPFLGGAGQLLRDSLKELNAPSFSATNVFMVHPPNNELAAFCVGVRDPNAAKELGPLASGKYLHKDLLPEIERLRAEISLLNPTHLLLLGGTASWAILKQCKITQVRGTLMTVEGRTVMATYHPAAILRSMKLLPVFVTDIHKLLTTMPQQSTSISSNSACPRRVVRICETIDDARLVVNKLKTSPILAIDIETKWSKQISSVSFSATPYESYVFPLINPDGTNVHADPAVEVYFHACIKILVESPARKVFQNGMYDMQFFFANGMQVRNLWFDTMIAQHAIDPATEKSLGFLVSVYLNAPNWKTMNQKGLQTLKEADL